MIALLLRLDCWVRDHVWRTSRSALGFEFCKRCGLVEDPRASRERTILYPDPDPTRPSYLIYLRHKKYHHKKTPPPSSAAWGHLTQERA